MKKFRDFEGKDIDSAIQAACDHFDKDRDDLEIEILSGGSTGIFGLVGVKRARIQARMRGAISSHSTQEESAPTEAKAPERKRSAEPKKPSEPKKPAEPKKQAESKKPVESQKTAGPKKSPAPKKSAPREAAQGADRRMESSAAPTSPAVDPDLPRTGQEPREEPVRGKTPRRSRESAPEERQDSSPARSRVVSIPPEHAEEVESDIRATVTTLLEAIVGNADLSIDMATDPIEVVIHDEENSGLIIGRDGQTITALQYLTNRMVSQKWPDVPRVQLDAGDYREKQEDQLKKTAEYLADKARRSGRVQSSRPLSSYHRRVVHIALQEDRTVQTRSKGEGPMKRVLIIPKKAGNGRLKGKRPYHPEPEGEQE